MENREDILNELKELSPVVAAIGNVNVFSVPEGYFDNVSTTVLACIHEEQGIANIISADVPKDYFDNLADNILAKIKMQEEETVLSPLLQNIRNTNVFTVPKGYFDELPTQILSKINTKQPAKVIPFGRRIVKYAVAAALTGVMALGIYTYTNKPSQPEVTETQPTAKLDESIEKGKNMDDKQFNDALASLSVDDIAKYLEKNGDEKDIELLASNLDENSLPSQDDYILDEKTLDNYLAEPDTQKAKN